MTREEMTKIVTDTCDRYRRCSVCPLCDFGNCFTDTMTDEELAGAVEIITGAKYSKEAVMPTNTPTPVDEKIQQVKHTIAVSRDMLLEIKGSLVILAACGGVTITDAIADELTVMVNQIESALLEGECLDEH